ncbi:nucleotide-binding protein [Aneurinibacillus tyrosinisolvens]|uniref:nucleotide-binding protein n=1 Tax=Aneurinibacillus tyrosinisolvens TaxID=1443435 RepID=UPI00063F8510|nr:hypothetical protein [Aneurinibacillus tyrosinisolvens]
MTVKIAILSKTANIGNSVADFLSRYDTIVYTNSTDIAEEKVLLSLFNFKESEVLEHLERLKLTGKDFVVILQDYELNRWEQKFNSERVKFIVNGQDEISTLSGFLDEVTKLERTRRRSFVAVQPVGGCGKSLVSTYLGKRAAKDQRIRMIDWDSISPSLHNYFEGKAESNDLILALSHLRNRIPFDMSEYETEVEKNIIATNMSLNYMEASKWLPEHFLHLWDYFQKQPEQVAFYQISNYPMFIPSAVALMRGTDIILPIRAEQRVIEPARYFVDWLRKNRTDDMPHIHVIVNHYNDSEAPISLDDIAKTLGVPVEHSLPYVEEMGAAVVSGEAVEGKGSRSVRKAVEKLEAFYESLAINVAEGAESDKKKTFAFWRN